MNWLEIASLPLAAGIIAVFGYVLYRIFKLVLGILVERMVKPLESSFEAHTKAIETCVEMQTKTVNNHLEHSAKADDRLAEAVDRLIDKLG